MFTTVTRQNGVTVKVLAEGTPEHIEEQVKAAHDRWDALPNDLIYEVCSVCEDLIWEGNDPGDPDFARMVADRATPVYSWDLMAVLHEDWDLVWQAEAEMQSEFGDLNGSLEDRIRSVVFYLIEQTAAAYMEGYSAGPGIEVFEASEGEPGEDADGEPMPAGWYWQACFPGCLPDGDAFGPFDSEGLAIAAARGGE